MELKKYQKNVIQDLSRYLELLLEKQQFNTIVHKQGDKTYVHGGIAMFGGGKNYGVFEAKNYTFKALNGYAIGLDDVNKHALAIAAGQEDFYFLLNDTTTNGFLPDDQARILNSTDAYSPIYLA